MIAQSLGCGWPPAPRRNVRRPVLVVDEVGATRPPHQIDAELVRDASDDQT